MRVIERERQHEERERSGLVAKMRMRDSTIVLFITLKDHDTNLARSGFLFFYSVSDTTKEWQKFNIKPPELM